MSHKCSLPVASENGWVFHEEVRRMERWPWTMCRWCYERAEVLDGAVHRWGEGATCGAAVAASSLAIFCQKPVGNGWLPPAEIRRNERAPWMMCPWRHVVRAEVFDGAVHRGEGDRGGATVTSPWSANDNFSARRAKEREAEGCGLRSSIN